MMAREIRCWIEAMRLRTLPVSVAGVMTGLGYAAGGGEIEAGAAALCFGVAVLAQIASNFANEYYDWANGLDKAGREGPRRGVTEGDITPRAMKTATFVTLALACVCGLGLLAYGQWWLIAVGAGIAAGVYAYSAGPYPLSHHGLGEAAVVIFFGIVPVNLTCWLCGGIWDMNVFLGSLAIGLLGANVLIVNNYRDADDDRAVGKRTLAVKLGARWMPGLYAANAVAAVALMGDDWHGWWIAAPVGALAGELAIARAMTRLKGRSLTPLLGMTAVTMAVYSLIFALEGLMAS